MTILSRVQDWLRERRIKALAREMKRAVEMEMPESHRRVLWDEFKHLHEQRSASQVARMERTKGL